MAVPCSSFAIYIDSGSLGNFLVRWVVIEHFLWLLLRRDHILNLIEDVLVHILTLVLVLGLQLLRGIFLHV